MKKPLPFYIEYDFEKLRATIRGCDEALSADLEPWERKEFQEARDSTADNLAGRIAALESLGFHTP